MYPLEAMHKFLCLSLSVPVNRYSIARVSHSAFASLMPSMEHPATENKVNASPAFQIHFGGRFSLGMCSMVLGSWSIWFMNREYLKVLKNGTD